MRTVRSYALAAVVAALAACSTVNAPVPKLPDPNPATTPRPAGLPERFLAVWVEDAATGRMLEGVDVRVTPTALGAPADFARTNADGWSGRSVTQGDYHVVGALAGYLEEAVDASVTAHTDAHLHLRRAIPTLAPLRVEGVRFADGFQWRGGTAFTLLRDFVAGQDVVPYLDARRAAGANILRVLTTMKNIADFPPTAYSDGQLGALLAVAHARGLRLELVALADAQDWPIEKQRAQVQRVVDAVAAAGGLDAVEVANEPFKNSAPPEEVMRGVTRRPGVVMASGDYLLTSPQPTLWHLDYQTIHNDRKDEWPRTAKDVIEYRDGFDWKDGEAVVGSFQGVHVPVVSDEPMGADEVDQPGRRAGRRGGESDDQARGRIADDFYWFGATAAIMGAGATFHSTAGITDREPGPITAAGEAAMFAAMQAVDVGAQTWRYTRGLLADCPLEHDDAKALRTFCKYEGNQAICVVLRPTAAWTATARAGWQISSSAGPRGTLIRLTK